MRQFFLKMQLPVFLISCIVLSGFTQEAETPEYGWKNQIIGTFTLTQAQFDNWSQGGENTLAWQLSGTGSFVNITPKFSWTNSGKLIYGQAKIGDVDARKSADEIRFESLYEHNLHLPVYPYVSAQLITQMTKGYQYTEELKIPVSNFMDPGYITFGAGFGYTPVEYLKSRLGVASKITVTKEYAVGITDDPATEAVEKTDVEFGMQSVTELSKQLAENILLTSKLELFSNLNRIDEVDVRWDSLLAMKVSRFIDVSLNLELFYDKNISTKRQLKQLLALGLSYSFL
jgi:hypothetical protein